MQVNLLCQCHQSPFINFLSRIYHRNITAKHLQMQQYLKSAFSVCTEKKINGVALSPLGCELLSISPVADWVGQMIC